MAYEGNPLVNPAQGLDPYDLLGQTFRGAAEAERAGYEGAINRLLESGRQDTAPHMDQPFPTGGILGAIAGAAAGMGGLLPNVMRANQMAEAQNMRQQGFLKLRQQQRDEKIAELGAKQAGVGSELAVQEARLELERAKSEEDKRRWQKTYDLRVQQAADNRRTDDEKYREITSSLGANYAPLFDALEPQLAGAKSPEDVERLITQFENQFGRSFVLGQDPIVDNWYASQLARLRGLAPSFDAQPELVNDPQQLLRDEFGIMPGEIAAQKAGEILGRGGDPMQDLEDKLNQVLEFDVLGTYESLEPEIDPAQSAILPPDVFQASEALAKFSQDYQKRRNSVLRRLTNPVED